MTVAQYPQAAVSSLGGDGERMKMEHGGDDGDEEMERDGGGLTVAVMEDGGHGW